MSQAIVCGVYAIVGRDGREYIGSSRDVFTRVMGHYYALRKGRSPHKRLQSAWNELGGEAAFTIVVLEAVADPADLAEAEQRQFDRRMPVLNVVHWAARRNPAAMDHWQRRERVTA